MLSLAQQSRLTAYLEKQSSILGGRATKYNQFSNILEWFELFIEIRRIIISIPIDSTNSIGLPWLLNITAIIPEALQNYQNDPTQELSSNFFDFFDQLQLAWIQLLDNAGANTATVTELIRLKSIIEDINLSIQEYLGIYLTTGDKPYRSDILSEVIEPSMISMPSIQEESPELKMECKVEMEIEATDFTTPEDLALSTLPPSTASALVNNQDSSDEEFEEVEPSEVGSIKPITISLGHSIVPPPPSTDPSPLVQQRDSTFDDPFAKKLDPDESESESEEGAEEEELEDSYMLQIQEKIDRLFSRLLKKLDITLNKS